MAILFSTPKLPPAKAYQLIDTYFPLPEQCQEHKMLFIRTSTLAEQKLLKRNRAEVLAWYELAKSAAE